MSSGSSKNNDANLFEFMSSQQELTLRESSRAESNRREISWEKFFLCQSLRDHEKEAKECEKEEFSWENMFLNKKSPDVNKEIDNERGKGESYWEEQFFKLSSTNEKPQSPFAFTNPSKNKLESKNSKVIPSQAKSSERNLRPLLSPQITNSLEILWSNILVETSSVPLSILFTGARRGEGVSFVSYHFAVYLSTEHSFKTVYIDLDVDSKSHPILKDRLRKLPGVSHFFLDNYPIKDLLVETEYKSFFLLPYGHRGNSPKLSNILFNKNQLRDFMNYFRENFDVVIVDGPPIILRPEVSIFAREVDNVILVCRYRFSQYEISQLAVEKLVKAGVKKILAVLNDRHFPIPDIIYRRLK